MSTNIELDSQWDFEEDLLIDYEEDSVWVMPYEWKKMLEMRHSRRLRWCLEMERKQTSRMLQVQHKTSLSYNST